MTYQLVVVADNRSVSLALTGLDNDLLDLRPDEFDGWIRYGNRAQVLVVGVDQPADALEIMSAATARHDDMPVLLVASNAPGWSSVAGASDDLVSVLPLPVTRLSLVAAVQRLATTALVPAHGLSVEEPEQTAAEDPADEASEPTDLDDEPTPAEARVDDDVVVQPPPDDNDNDNDNGTSTSSSTSTSNGTGTSN